MFSETDFKYLPDECLQTLMTIMQNILDNPSDERFCKVSKASKRYQNSLCDKTGRAIPIVLLVLSATGFADGVDSFTCVDKDEIAMKRFVEIIQNVLDGRSKKPRMKSAFDFEPRRDLAADTRKMDDQLAQIREEQTKRFSRLSPSPSTEPPRDDTSSTCLVS